MDPGLLAAFGVIINTRSEAVARNEQRLIDTIDSDADGEESWDAIFSILNHAGVLSRLFWPPKLPRNPAKDTALQRDRRTRHKELRAWFNLADDSALSVSGRDLRNGIEHWDEDVEDWLSDKAGLAVHDSIITARPLPTDTFFIRAFNYRTWWVSYGNNSLLLRPVIAEVHQLQKRFKEVRPELALPTHANPILGGGSAKTVQRCCRRRPAAGLINACLTLPHHACCRRRGHRQHTTAPVPLQRTHGVQQGGRTTGVGTSTRGPRKSRRR